MNYCRNTRAGNSQKLCWLRLLACPDTRAKRVRYLVNDLIPDGCLGMTRVEGGEPGCMFMDPHQDDGLAILAGDEARRYCHE
jgi:hypothetical protein